MKRNSIAIKSISYLILVVMAYMHVCSALCAAGSGGCCEKSKNANSHVVKSCCSHKKQGHSKDCQDFHLSFFKTTGQFNSDKSDLEFKGLHFLFAIPFVDFKTFSVLPNKVVFTYNVFHPPNLYCDIRITISSFQI